MERSLEVVGVGRRPGDLAARPAGPDRVAFVTSSPIAHYGRWAEAAGHDIAEAREAGDRAKELRARHGRWPLDHEIMGDVTANCSVPPVTLVVTEVEPGPHGGMTLQQHAPHVMLGWPNSPPFVVHSLDLDTGQVANACLASWWGWLWRVLPYDLAAIFLAPLPTIALVASFRRAG